MRGPPTRRRERIRATRATRDEARLKLRAFWLVLSAAVCTAVAAPPTTSTPTTPPPSAPPAAAPAPPPADELLIEFLGADDVGDAGWWDFLKTTEPRAGQSPPQQDPSQ